MEEKGKEGEKGNAVYEYSKHFLRVYFVPGTALESRDTEMSKVKSVSSRSPQNKQGKYLNT